MKTNLKKILFILLCASIFFGILTGTMIRVNAAESAEYAFVAAPESGKDYLIAYTEGGTKAHVLDNESMVTASPGSEKVSRVELPVNEGIIATDDESLVWTVTSYEGGWLIQPRFGDHTDKCFYPSTTRTTLYLNGETSRAWTYSGNKLTYESKFLRYSQSSDGFIYSGDNRTNTISFYELVDSSISKAPVFSSSTYKMPSADADTAKFMLTNTYDSPEFNVYANNSDDTPVGDVTARFDDDTLTLEFDEIPTADATYYISVTDGGKKESPRKAIYVEAYTETFVYSRVDNINSGGIYLIAVEDDGDYFAMNTKMTTSSSSYGYLGFDLVTGNEDGNEIILEEKEARDVEWVLTGSDNSFTMYNRAKAKYVSLYINPSYTSYLYGLSLESSGTVWAYNSINNTVSYTAPDSEPKYDKDAWLYYSSKNNGFRANTERSNASTIYIFQKQEDIDVPSAPAFSSSTYIMPSADADTAKFILTNTYDSPEFNVYANNSDATPAGDVTARFDDDTLTLEFDEIPTADATYYISVIVGEKGESSRTAVYIIAYDEDDSDSLAFTSDVHYSGTNNLKTWLDLLDSKDVLEEGQLDYMGFCGDMASYNAYGNSYWTYVETILNTVTESNLISTTPGFIYTTGNHEYLNGNYGTTSNSTAKEIKRIGEAAETENYIIYCFGAASSTQEFTDNDVDDLEEYLDAAPDDIPIIILSHYPIHNNSSRNTINAGALIDVLNAEHENVIFLWGHNHSVSDTKYGEVNKAGSTINYYDSATKSTKSAQIDFTYAAAGCMSDGAIKQKGMIMEVADDGSKVTMTYYGLDGKSMGITTVDIRDSSNADLSSLSYSLAGAAQISCPGFSPTQNEYSITLPYGTPDGSQITLYGVCDSKDALIMENAGATLENGAATAKITVKAEDLLSTRTYTLHFTVSATQGARYILTDDFVDGGEYIIAYVDSGNAYCLDADELETGSSGTTATAAIEGIFEDTIITSDESILWKVKKSGSGWLISPATGSNSARRLYMGYGSTLYLDADGRAMSYDNDKLFYTSSSSTSTYYLSYSDGEFLCKTSNPSNISLFAPFVDAVGIELPEAVSVREGRTVQLNATLIPANANSAVKWSVESGEAFAAVDETGLVTGLAEGTAIISASANGLTADCTVTVTGWLDPDTIKLAFTSDTHYESGVINNLDRWLTDMSQRYQNLEHIGITGDIGSTSSTSVNEYWEFVQDIIDTVDAHGSFVTGGGIYTTGNHEQYAGPVAGGDYEKNKNSNATAKKLTQNGVAANNKDYVVYCFGASNNVTTSLVQEFTQTQIKQLETFLNSGSVPDNIPIFIMSHYPLHYDGNRIVERSEEVIAILNEHPNVIFLWGHNHSDAGEEEDGYDNILKSGDSITTLNIESGVSKTTGIKFTYAAAGCMSDEEYYSSSAAVLGKGIVAEITDIAGGKQVTLVYYNLEGEPFTVAGKNTSDTMNMVNEGQETCTISWDTDGDGTVDDTTTAAYGSMPAHADGSKAATAQYTYTFTGWEPALSFVIGPVTYTAQFTSEVNSYTISWDTDGDGTVDDTTTAAYGTMPAHADGSKAATAEYKYTFTGWEPALSNVTGPVTYTAIFTATPITSGSGGNGGSGGSGGRGGSGSSTVEDIPDEDVPAGSADSSDEKIIFDDVPENSWYYDAVQYVAGRGLLNGVSDRLFEPDMALTRGMLVTMLWRLEGEPEVTTPILFTDIAAGAWYANAVNWAHVNGIVKGYSAYSFGPEDLVTREQMATILYRYASYKAHDVTSADDLAKFNDSDEISPWALTEVRWAVAEGIITGVSETSISPKGNTSRAQAAAIIMRFVENK